MNYKELRQKYPEFVYKSYNYQIDGEDLVIEFSFTIDPGINFTPKLIYKNCKDSNISNLDKDTLSNFVFNLGLAEMPSYWKLTCSPKIVVEAGHLDDYQLRWWHKLLISGMGQFFYENKIDFTEPNFIAWKSDSNKMYKPAKLIGGGGVLIPVGGGKDSAVTLELLKDFENAHTFLVNPKQSALDLANASGIKKTIIVERVIDPKLFELNNLGFLNGHTPFSSVIAFLSVFAAHLYGLTEVALSNERSSDEGNTEYLGYNINHQFSKTLEFENDFREYVGKYLSDTNYFSFLRPLYDIQIAKIFSTLPMYFQVFKSCNVGQKTDSWCNNCSKCLSTYILLSPFLKEEELSKIFGSNLIKKDSLANLMKDLTEEGRVKPFECVGTRRELRDAISNNMELVSEWNGKNNLPKKYERLLREKI